VADRTGPHPVLGAALVGMGVGAVLVTLPGLAAVAGILVLGLSAAPMFPLLTLTTRERIGPSHVDRAVGVQVAASAAGAALLPAAVGVLLDWFGAGTLGPCLIVMAGATATAYAATTATPCQPAR
jgi:fucose permease